MIEVMIAVVVLATGLLALAALQTSLTRSAADARARSQIAAFVDLVAERQRTAAATSFSSVPSSGAWSSSELSTIESNAGVSNLAVSVSATHYDGRTGTFTTCDSTCGASISTSDPQYKEVHIVATWTDATGASRRYDMTSTISPRTVGDSITPLNSPTSGGSTSVTPTVRTSVPSDDGIIPIAIGDNTDTAATNPKPKLSSGNVVRTSFEVLTYTNEGTTAVQQRRVETAIVGCKCRNGTAFSSSNAQFSTAQWPAYWNGSRYTIYEPSDNAAAPGATAGRATANVTQDTLCTECCRDHHDSSSSSVVHFDPYSFARDGQAHQHYTLSGSTYTVASGSDIYREACRMIRVDGFWRTAVDMNDAYMNLLATENNGDNYSPSTTAQDHYENMVIDYLDTRFTNASGSYNSDLANSTVAGLETTNSINDPSSITIARTGGVKWSHLRGLYIDYLEQDTLDAISAAKAKSSCSGTAASACVLPLIPFTSINLTELADYTTTSSTQIVAENNSFSSSTLSNSGGQSPIRGKVRSGTSPTSNSTADATAQMTKSNAGLAVITAISDDDAVTLSDAQRYQIQGSSTPDGTGGDFYLQFSPYTFQTGSNAYNPAAAFTVSSTSGSCNYNTASSGPNPYTCSAPSLSGAVTLMVNNYNTKSSTTSTYSVSTSCSGNRVTATCTVEGSGRPLCNNYTLSSVSGSGVIGTVTGTGKAETTTVTYPSIAVGDTLTFGFTLSGTTEGSVKSCSLANGNNADCTSAAITWEDPCL